VSSFFPALLPAAILGIDTGDPVVDAAIVAALASVAVAVLRGVALIVSGQQERRRNLFSEAYKAAMAWGEMLYRVRRRANSAEAERALTDRFHDLQERIDYFQGWTASEGRWIGRSYCRLVDDIKVQTRPLLQEARARPGHRFGEAPSDGRNPDLSEARDRFLTDIRAQLSLLIVPRLMVIWRNWGGDNETKPTTMRSRK
jgi:hypothetical protein